MTPNETLFAKNKKVLEIYLFFVFALSSERKISSTFRKRRHLSFQNKVCNRMGFTSNIVEHSWLNLSKYAYKISWKTKVLSKIFK